ncbi:hypothetical protein [Listeria grandensis]|uniref:Lmo2079 family surface lipoprotein n=1 Tax=Listeria grandensis TaxID=1494963 RepID=UPI00164DB1C1|nr:hypothetical protein [Listeria grandensis]MBC6316802.1 hypothetical protein [Listeria grandensis]
MKKAIAALAVIILSVTIILAACSSPKSEFMSSFRGMAKNKQYTAVYTLKPITMAGFDTLAFLNPDALAKSSLTMKTSRDLTRDLTYNTYGLHVGGVPTMDITAHSFENGNTGKIYVPVADLYQTPNTVTNTLDLATDSVFSRVLADNKDLKNRHLDVLQALQNITNRVIDEKTVDEQSSQLRAIEQKTAFALYKKINSLDKSHYKTQDRNITLTLDKKELAELSNAWLEGFQTNKDFIALYAEVSGLTETEAKKTWLTTDKKAQETLKELITNADIKLGMTITMHPDADKGVRKLAMSVNYEDTSKKQKLNFDFTMELLHYEQIPTPPDPTQIITKKELDKLITDIIREQRKTK